MKSIKGKIIISTRPLSDNDSINCYLQEQGADIVYFPMIEITGSDNFTEKEEVFKNITEYNHIIFTSKNGVKYFFDCAHKYQAFINICPSVQFSVIGERTADELRKYNFTNIYIAKGKTSKEFLEELLIKEEIKSQNILLVLGNLAADTMEKGLSKIAKITRFNIYITQTSKTASLEIISQIKNNKYDVIVFTSPSGIENFVNIMRNLEMNKDFRIACIGKTTEQKAIENNIIPVLTASKSNGENFAKEIQEYLLTH